MKLRKKLILFSMAAILLTGVGIFAYYNIQVKSLTKLGYTLPAAKSKVNIKTIVNVVSKEKKTLEGSVSKQKQELLNLGLTEDNVAKVDIQEKKLVNKISTLENTKKEREVVVDTQLKVLEQQAAKFKVKYNYPNANCFGKYTYLKEHLLQNYDSKIKDYQKYLKKNGYTNKEIKKLSGKTKYRTMTNLQSKLNKERKVAKELKSLNGFATKELKNSAMRMYKETNAYRKSKGLKPYKYNSTMQSCVFTEAAAYANNKNPHNWLCKPAANENAALASSKSDYIKIAMDFFISDPPHEAVLSGNYNSVAIAIVQKDGMNYMIMDVFK